MFTEFGADAFNEITMAEDQKSQAEYDLWSWKEIYENAAGLGKADNCIGGFTFQFSDGWWKYKQTSNLDIHDTDALLQKLTELNPKFNQYQFSIAINKKLVDSVTKLNEGDEIALLPPFAGG